MTYKPRLHHFTCLLMSIAAGLSFTGCGNSSNGGSTGSSFEPVPLIDKDYAGVVFQSDDASDPKIEIVLQSDDTLRITIITGGQDESFSGSGRATQRFNNTYQIELSGNKLTSRTCEMTCNALILTIPEGRQLEAYRNGQEVTGATLYVDFTHTAGASCPLNQGSPWTIKDTMTGNIQQKTELPPQ